MGFMFEINPVFSSNSQLVDLMTNIHSRFESCGEVVFKNKRNLIKSYNIDGLGTVVVKRFRVMNVFQKLFYTFKGTSKARNAFHNGCAMQQFNISTPTPYAYAEVKSCGLLSYCYYACSFTDSKPIVNWLDKPLNRDLIGSLAQYLVGMHTCGLVHHDMNKTNILYSENGSDFSISAIDINRMRRKPAGQQADYAEMLDDFVRFTDRMDIIMQLAYDYAKLRGFEQHSFAMDVAKEKIKFDSDRSRIQKIKAFFRGKKNS